MIQNTLTGETIDLMLGGLKLTIALTFSTSILALLIGVSIGIGKISRRRLWQWLASAYIEIFRNIPALMLMIFLAFAFPNLFPDELRRDLFFQNAVVTALVRWTGLSIPYYTLATGFALTLNTSAYLAELFRAGVGTIPQEHIDAARSLGASQGPILRRILIPEGIRAAFPAITTRLIHNMKNTALAALVSTPELFHNTNTAITRSFQAIQLLLLAAGIYLLLSISFSSLMTWIERQVLRPSAFPATTVQAVSDVRFN